MELHFDKAIQILGKTYPFLILRLVIYSLIMVGATLWFGLVFLLSQSWPFPGPAWLAWIFGGVVFASGIKLLRNYLLYLVKAAHIAVITRLVADGKLPEGTGQVSFGKDLVIKQFLQISLLFLVDRLVNMVLRTFNRSVFSLFSFVPGIRGLRKFVQRVLDYSVGYIDEAILSYSILHPEQNPWQSARDGLLLYVQNWKTILASGAILAVISFALTAILAAPGILLTYWLGGPFRALGMALFGGIALLVKFVLMDPFAMVSIIVNYHAAIAGQKVNPEWDRNLEGMSDHYRELKQKAQSWATGPGPVPTPTTLS